MGTFIRTRFSKLRASWHHRRKGNYSLVSDDTKRHHTEDFTDEGNGALHQAAKLGYYGRVKFLLENGLDIHAKNKDGDDALMLAAKHGHKKIVKKLLASGADVSAKNKSGATAYGLAVMNERIEVANIIALYKCNIRYGNNYVSRSTRLIPYAGVTAKGQEIDSDLTRKAVNKEIKSVPSGRSNIHFNSESSAVVEQSSLSATTVNHGEHPCNYDRTNHLQVIETRICVCRKPRRDYIDEKIVRVKDHRPLAETIACHSPTVNTLWIIKSTRPDKMDNIVPLLDAASPYNQDTILASETSSIQNTLPMSNTSLYIADSYSRAVFDSPKMSGSLQDETRAPIAYTHGCRVCQAAEVTLHSQECQTDLIPPETAQDQQLSAIDEKRQKQISRPTSMDLHSSSSGSNKGQPSPSLSQKSLMTVNIRIDQNQPTDNLGGDPKGNPTCSPTVSPLVERKKSHSSPELTIFYYTKHYNIHGQAVAFDGSVLNNKVHQETDTANEEQSLELIAEPNHYRTSF